MKLPLRVDTLLALSDVVTATGGTLRGEKSLRVTGVSLDSRAVQKGDLFFALHAARDGHEFVADAFSKGAAAAVVSRHVDGANTIQVSDTTKALLALGRYARRTWGKNIISIGGANGKTTTKEMTAALIGARFNVLKTPSNWNNMLGLSLTLLLLKPEHEVAVVEMGINDFGEMTTLATTAEPNVGLLTSIGPAHLEKLGSLDGVARAEGELFAYLGEKGTAVVNIDDTRIDEVSKQAKGNRITVSRKSSADVMVRVLESLGKEGLLLDVNYGGKKLELRSPFVGEHNVSNLCCALGAALATGVPSEAIQKGLHSVERPEMRLELLDIEGVHIINDCYNANPGSVLAALHVGRDMKVARRFAVLGDMLELGDYSPRAHRDIGIEAAHMRYDHLFAVGQFAGDLGQGALQGGMGLHQVTIGKSRSETAEAVATLARPGDLILIKGSRGMKMEEVTEKLTGLLRKGRA